ncbi:MAG: hypothetical protein NTV34_10660, partial [Proteobacteria bacterium]|nr:hypothetical protein [Pseudomonadota bacterium]
VSSDTLAFAYLFLLSRPRSFIHEIVTAHAGRTLCSIKMSQSQLKVRLLVALTITAKLLKLGSSFKRTW